MARRGLEYCDKDHSASLACEPPAGALPVGLDLSGGRLSPRRWWPPLLWAALILTVSSVPARNLPDVGISDKIEHAAAYAVLAALALRSAGLFASAAVWTRVLLAVSAFGAADEWHQRFIPGRQPDVLDWAADSTGALVACGAMLALRLTLPRRELPT